MDFGGCLRFLTGAVIGCGGALAAWMTLVGLATLLVWPRASPVVPRPVPAPPGFTVRGIDVSHHQGAIDWDAVAGSGQVGFAYVKATEGTTHHDRRFHRNWKGARRVGIPVGAYHYLSLCRGGREQAAHFVARVPKEPDALPPVVDVEPDPRCNQGARLATAATVVEEWIEVVEAHYGVQPIVYTSAWFHRNYLSGVEAPVWAASYSRRPKTSRGWLFWQFTDRGRVPGVTGAVDWNVFAGNEAELAALIAPGTG